MLNNKSSSTPKLSKIEKLQACQQAECKAEDCRQAEEDRLFKEELKWLAEEEAEWKRVEEEKQCKRLEEAERRFKAELKRKTELEEAK